MSVSRRAFISRGSLGMLVAGAAAVVPGLSMILKASPPPVTALRLPATGDPLVAHVRNVASGEISLMVGNQKAIVRDVELVNRLYRAAQTRLGGN